MDKSSNSGCLGIIARLFGGGVKSSDQDTAPDQKTFPYRKRDDFLSKAEISFYHVLSRCVPDSVVFTKVRLADILFVPQMRENYGAQNRIQQKHIDFLVCSAGDLVPLFGVELDDQSHGRSKLQERDAFVEEVFKAAGLALLRIKASDTYSPEEIRGKVAGITLPAVSSSPVVSVEAVVPPVAADAGSDPMCPRCGVAMVIRTARQGSNAGKNFYGCKNYPRCKETIQV